MFSWEKIIPNLNRTIDDCYIHFLDLHGSKSTLQNMHKNKILSSLWMQHMKK